MIQTIDRATYYRERAAVDLAETVLRALWPGWQVGGAIPQAVTRTPEWQAVDNAMRGRVEQFEILHNPPERLTAYLGKPDGRFYPVTVWTGLQIGTATRGATWRVDSFVGSHMGQFSAGIAGREYTGRGFGSGCCINLRETAESKRDRGAT